MVQALILLGGLCELTGVLLVVGELRATSREVNHFLSRSRSLWEEWRVDESPHQAQQAIAEFQHATRGLIVGITIGGLRLRVVGIAVLLIGVVLSTGGSLLSS